MIIAIDGPSGTGKSTVAKGVAMRLGFTFFDTGAMYRSLSWMILQEGIDPADREKIRLLLPRFQFETHTDEKGERRYFVGGIDVTGAIRHQRVSHAASQIGTYSEVRQSLVPIQRKFGAQCNGVFEGRDMGTVVFPDADLKIFLTARPEVRAERRFRELLTKFPDLAATLSFDQILKEIKERDHQDATRALSPLYQAPDAILIDTSELTAEEVIDKILKIRPRKKDYSRMKLSYAVVYWIARIFFKLFYRLKIYGLEHYRTGPGILAANHASNYDPPLLSISCPEEVHFLAKETLFDVPLLGRLIRILNTHPVSPGTSNAHTFRLMLQILQEGKKLILFPEGSRTLDGQLQPLERGLPFLVHKAECSIFPAYLYGTFETWPRTRKFPKLTGRLICAFGTPIEWREFAALDKKEAHAKILQRMEESFKELKAWVENGAKGIPP